MENRTQDYKHTRTISILTCSFVFVLFLGLLLFIAFPLAEKRIITENKPTITFDSTKSITIRDTTRVDSIKRIVISNEIKTIKVDTSSAGTAPVCKDCTKDRLDTSFPYFTLLFGVLLLLILLPRLKTFKVTKDGVEGELHDLAKAFNEAQNQNAQNPQLPQGGKTATHDMIRNFTEEKIRLVEQIGGLDPQKGKWGGLSANNNRKLSAVITKIIGSDWADVVLRVESTNAEVAPLKGFVVFHLHPTFNNSTPVIIVLNGIAELKIKAWGAFTAGAVADNGSTKLELDLAENADAFEPFKSR